MIWSRVLGLHNLPSQENQFRIASLQKEGKHLDLTVLRIDADWEEWPKDWEEDVLFLRNSDTFTLGLWIDGNCRWRLIRKGFLHSFWKSSCRKDGITTLVTWNVGWSWFMVDGCGTSQNFTTQLVVGGFYTVTNMQKEKHDYSVEIEHVHSMIWVKRAIAWNIVSSCILKPECSKQEIFNHCSLLFAKGSKSTRIYDIMRRGTLNYLCLQAQIYHCYWLLRWYALLSCSSIRMKLWGRKFEKRKDRKWYWFFLLNQDHFESIFGLFMEQAKLLNHPVFSGSYRSTVIIHM